MNAAPPDQFFEELRNNKTLIWNETRAPVSVAKTTYGGFWPRWSALKAAIRGHLKTGQWSVAGTSWFYASDTILSIAICYSLFARCVFSSSRLFIFGSRGCGSCGKLGAVVFSSFPQLP